MEPPQKRQRLLEPANDKQLQIYDTSADYNLEPEYDDEEDFEDFVDDEEEFEYGESDMVPYGVGNRNEDPDLAEKRARVDQKLKSSWELLFEKFSKDFTDVGDEIDLATGEIVVDNGHLKSMLDEGDIGHSIDGKRLLRALTVEPEGLSALVSLSEGEQSGSASQTEDEGTEEDVILDSTEQHKESEAETQDSNISQDFQISRVDNGNTLPSTEEILKRFGELGPEVIQLLDRRKGSRNEDSIEPAWRFPELPTQSSGKRPLLKSAFIQETYDERSTSPNRATSLWSAPAKAGIRPISQRPNQGIEYDEHKSALLDFEDELRGRPRPKRRPYSNVDDEVLLEEMTKAKKLGLCLEKRQVYDHIAAKYPHRSAREWYQRWYKTRRMAKSVSSGSSRGKEWIFDGLEWVRRAPEPRGEESSLQPSRTVEYVKRVFQTERPGRDGHKDLGVHTFMGVLISETQRGRSRSTSRVRFQELSSHQLGSAGSSFENETGDIVPSSSSQLRPISAERSPPTHVPAKRPRGSISWDAVDPGVTRSAQRTYRAKRINALQKPGPKTSMYPCLEDRCDRKGGNGFRKPGRLIKHVKAKHDSRGAWVRLQRILDAKTFTANGIYFDKRFDDDSTTDAVDELQDESSGLGIHTSQISSDVAELPQSLPRESPEENVPAVVQDDKQVEPLSSPNLDQLTIETDRVDPKAASCDLGSEVLPNDSEDAFIPSYLSIERTIRPKRSARPRVSSANPALSSSLTSPFQNLESLSFSSGEKKPASGSCNTEPIIINSSPPQHNHKDNTNIFELPTPPRSDDSTGKQNSKRPEIPDNTASSSPLPPTTISPPKTSPTKQPIPTSHRTNPSKFPDPDDLDELSILSPSLTSSLMTCHSVTPSRTSSPIPSHFKNKAKIQRTRNSLPMSAIPARIVQKTSRGSLSAYKAPSSSGLRKMVLPVTPTKKKGISGSGFGGGFGSGKGKEKESGGLGMDEVFRTPGGTMRRCGVEGVSCGREFCFRCLGGGK